MSEEISISIIDGFTKIIHLDEKVIVNTTNIVSVLEYYKKNFTCHGYEHTDGIFTWYDIRNILTVSCKDKHIISKIREMIEENSERQVYDYETNEAIKLLTSRGYKVI